MPQRMIQVLGSSTTLLLLAGIVVAQDGFREERVREDGFSIGVDDNRVQLSQGGWIIGKGSDPCNSDSVVATSSQSDASLSMSFQLKNPDANEMLLWGARQPSGVFMTLQFDGTTKDIDTSLIGEQGAGPDMCSPLAMIQNIDATQNHSFSITHKGPGNGVPGSGFLTIDGFTFRRNGTVGGGPSGITMVTTPQDLLAAIGKAATKPSGSSSSSSSASASAGSTSSAASSASSVAAGTTPTPPSPLFSTASQSLSLSSSSSITPDPSQAAAASNSKNLSKGSSSNAGLIAGIVVGVLALLVVAFIIFMFMRRRQRRMELENGVWNKNFFNIIPAGSNSDSTSASRSSSIKISGPTNFVHTSGAGMDEEGGMGGMKGPAEYMASLDAEKFQMPNVTAPLPVVQNIRPRHATPTPLAPMPYPPQRLPMEAEIVGGAEVVPTTPKTASLTHSHSHRKPVPPEVPLDVDPASGSPMPQVYSSASDSEENRPPLEPPPSLRPRNGSVAAPSNPIPSRLLIPDAATMP